LLNTAIVMVAFRMETHEKSVWLSWKSCTVC